MDTAWIPPKFGMESPNCHIHCRKIILPTPVTQSAPGFFLRRLACSCLVCSHSRCLHWGRNFRCPSGRVPLERQAAQPQQENYRQHPAGKHRGNIQRRGAHKEETRQQKDGKKHQEHDLIGQWLYALRGFVWWVLNLSMAPSGPLSYVDICSTVFSYIFNLVSSVRLSEWTTSPPREGATTPNNNIDINQYELFPRLNLAVYSHILLVWTAQHWVWTKIPNKNQSVCISCRLPV